MKKTVDSKGRPVRSLEYSPTGRASHLERYKFQKGVSGNPHGGRLLPDYLKNLTRETKNELQTTICNCFMDREAVGAIAKDKNSTPLQQHIAQQVVKVINEKDHALFESLITRAIGKPTEIVEMDVEQRVDNGNIQLTGLSGAELKTLLRIKKKIDGLKHTASSDNRIGNSPKGT